MIVYQQTAESEVTWPEPIEMSWQWVGGKSGQELAPKLPHLGLSEILFMTTVMSIARPDRPWGVVTWMAEVFGLSRPALYELVGRVQERLNPEPEAKLIVEPVQTGAEINVTRNRLVRTILMASLPGKTAIRPLRYVLAEAFDQTRSIGWISELLSEAGEQAGQVLQEIDTSPLGTVIVGRDETFFQGHPLLLVVDPVSTTILFAQASPDRQADTWGAALLIAQEQGVTIGGLVEDMAQMYGKSQREAELEVSVQKDVWHIQRDGSQLRRNLERTAFGTSKRVLALEKKLLKQWDDSLFIETYIPAVNQEERCYEQHDTFAQWLSHLLDALELVDWRSGEIRDRAINTWLLDETLTAMATIDHAAVQGWVKSLRRHQPQLLTSLAWLQTSLQAYDQHLAQIIPVEQHQLFLRTVARHWRLQQALINGHSSFAHLAQDAQHSLHSLIAHNPQRQAVVDHLLSLFDGACRTSSMVERVNGLLKQFLHNHQAFRSLDTLQLYLNLFVLWHNTRVFERGKRQGKSPYQLAGIEPASLDWLTLLGYPPL